VCACACACAFSLHDSNYLITRYVIKIFVFTEQIEDNERCGASYLRKDVMIHMVVHVIIIYDCFVSQ